MNIRKTILRISLGIPVLLIIMILLCVLLERPNLTAIFYGNFPGMNDTWYRDVTIFLTATCFVFIIVSTILIVIGLINEKFKVSTNFIIAYFVGLIGYFIVVYLDYFRLIEWLVGD